MITYREATSNDAEQIARLHSLSWQQNYRGIWRDEFLNGPVPENRQHVWQERLMQPTPNQYIIVAESEGTIYGFACIHVDKDPIWGTLLDNLHVHAKQKGKGIGTFLIKSAARWTYHKNPKSGFYLWVLPQNSNARTFYENLGATNAELVSQKCPDGGFYPSYRYVWPDVLKLI
ncbi:GNAT family N-acetyltransferase [Spirosoma endophyticum]|uniref:Ribosomal protein S18 acetylase RimI n=1 Tax=Spirosoma endophyticum TaxID=662367 RepID=A0A1I1WPD9_9BACT|nr:GNAT family N-acetyltransferase [Spirosoma endophyticum]SFD97064.1 Ribosomal protein S18 acetylase RimI [Spirosoma endophyticum]